MIGTATGAAVAEATEGGATGAAAGAAGRMNGGGTGGRTGVGTACAGIPGIDGRLNAGAAGVGMPPPTAGFPPGNPDGRGGNAAVLIGVGEDDVGIAGAAGGIVEDADGVPAGGGAGGVAATAGRGGSGAGLGGTAIGPGAAGCGITGVGTVPRLSAGTRGTDEGVNSSEASPRVPSFAIVMTPPHTAHRARTIAPAILAGSMRNTERHSGHATFTGAPYQTPQRGPDPGPELRAHRCADRWRTPIPATSSRSSSFLSPVRSLALHV